jgi:hypothetical protein
MNPTDPPDPFLDVLLAEPAALDAMHSAGLAALRRRRRWRMARVAIGSAAVAACLLFIMRGPRNEHEGKSQIAPPSLATSASAAALPDVSFPDVPPAVQELDDDELLRQFPPGTCTIAEVDGRKMLVFLGEEARAKFLR